MKKKLISIVFVLLILMTVSVDCFAEAREITLDLTADTLIKPNKDFYVYLNINSNVELGAFLVNLNYDNETFVMKSVELEGKSKDENLKYDDEDGNIYVMYSTLNASTAKTIKFRFVSPSYGSFRSEFAVYLLDGCDVNLVTVNQTGAVMNLAVSDNGNVSQSQTADTKTKVSGSTNSKAESAKRSSKTEKEISETSVRSSKENSESKEEDILEEETVQQNTEETEQGEYYLKDDNDFRKDRFPIFIGAVIVVCAVAWFAYRLGLKKSKQNIE